jgi:hypothetical protein
MTAAQLFSLIYIWESGFEVDGCLVNDSLVSDVEKSLASKSLYIPPEAEEWVKGISKSADDETIPLDDTLYIRYVGMCENPSTPMDR